MFFLISSLKLLKLISPTLSNKAPISNYDFSDLLLLEIYLTYLMTLSPLDFWNISLCAFFHFILLVLPSLPDLLTCPRAQ